MYYNTTNQSGQMLIDFEAKTKTQEDEVFEMFKSHKQLTPSQAWERFKTTGVPITSIRRAITNLSKEGRLLKTDQMLIGMFGRPETIYRLIVD